MEVRLALHDRVKGGLSTCEIRDYVGADHVTVRRSLAVAKTAALAACVAALETRQALARERARPNRPSPPVDDPHRLRILLNRSRRPFG